MSSLGSIIQCLEKTICPDRNVLIEAQLQLEENAKKDLGQFILNMSTVLAEPKNSPVARQAAGLQLKNCLSVREANLKVEYQRRWFSLPLQTRNTVCERLYSSLGTENIYPSCAAQCLACICAAEVLSCDSPCTTFLSDLLATFTNLLNSKTNNERTKQAAMETIGFICQELPPKILVDHSSEILGSILTCIGKHVPGNKIRLSAAHALLASLEFAYSHFEREGDRNLIMQVVCDATQSPVVEETVISLQILAKIASCYYHHLLNYMANAIMPITYKAILSEDPNVSLQGMEFWCSIAEIELDLASGVYDSNSVLPVSRRYAEVALSTLVPLLMNVVTDWQDEPDDFGDLDDWTPVKGAIACLTLLSKCCTDKIERFILPEVKTRIKDLDWKQRIASLWAVSSMLEETNNLHVEENLVPLMPLFWGLTYDHQSAKVRYAALMLTSRVLQTCPSLMPPSIGTLVKTLIYHLRDNSHVASAACHSLSSLVKVTYDSAMKEIQSKGRPATFPLSRYFADIVAQLLKYGGERRNPRLRSSAHHALKNVLTHSSEDCYDTVKKCIVSLLEQLQQLINAEPLLYEDYILLICSTLSSSLGRLDVNVMDTTKLQHDFMSCLMTFLQSGMNHEDIFEAIAATIFLLGPEMKTHLPLLASLLESAIKSSDVSISMVNLIGDLFRVLETETLPYLNNFCNGLFGLLSQNDTEPKLRTECIAVLNDMAITAGLNYFHKYLPATLRELQYASDICAKKDADYEEMQDNILKAYTTIFSIMSLEDSDQCEKVEIRFQPLMHECLTNLSKFIVAVVDDESSDMILTTSGFLVGLIVIKLGAVESMKYFKSNLDFKWLLNAAANRACSNECEKICKDALFELQDLLPS